MQAEKDRGMMSGGPFEKFTEGWAVKIGGWGRAHYWKRKDVGGASPVCGTYGSVRVAALRGAGTFKRCKGCESRLAKENAA